ncbi:MAG TPA: hypothetical protein VFE50_11935 [Cyclobacteriaceae bacterium]|nr:hypothetical protein [Cyclobacteriaceae bacterium]
MWRSLLLVFIVQSAVAQSELNAGVAFGKTQGTLSLAYVHNWFAGEKHNLVIGLGGRFTGYVGRNQYYVTAPAKLTSNGTGPLVIFKENITANMDTLLVAKPNVYAFNAMINLGYRFSEKFMMGFNIDLVGISFGGDRRGNYINGAQGKMTNSAVTTFNALLVSDNDLGSLNSELYGRYMINKRWAVRGGPQFLFTEYTTDSNVQQYPEPNDRFRKKSLMFMIGTSFNL